MIPRHFRHILLQSAGCRWAMTSAWSQPLLRWTVMRTAAGPSPRTRWSWPKTRVRLSPTLLLWRTQHVTVGIGRNVFILWFACSILLWSWFRWCVKGVVLAWLCWRVRNIVDQVTLSHSYVFTFVFILYIYSRWYYPFSYGVFLCSRFRWFLEDYFEFYFTYTSFMESHSPQCTARNFFFVKELYLFANEGENHTNNVKQLEEMKKGTEDTRADSLTTWKLTCGKLTSNQPSNQ